MAGDRTDRDLLKRLLLVPEHTWGTDTKTYLDYENYRPSVLAKVLNEPNYKIMEFSWKEKRDDIDEGAASLPDECKSEATVSLDGLKVVRPSTDGMTSHNPAQPIETKHFNLAFDPRTGAIVRLRNRTTGREWASPQHPLALFTYQTLSAQDYAVFMERYITIKSDWAPRDFGKPGIQDFHASSTEWHPRVARCWYAKQVAGDRVVVELAIEDAETAAIGNVAWPAQIFLEMFMPQEESRLDLKVVTLGKLENRMPEAMWLTFAPSDTGAPRWSFEKVDQTVDPLDVVRGGGRAMHAVSGAIRYRENQRSELAIQTLDAPVVAVGERSPLNFSRQLPDFSGGVHFSLFNNAWGTNYPQWCGEDWAFRFQVSA